MSPAESSRTPVEQNFARRSERVEEMLDRMSDLRPGQRSLVVCASASIAELVERHPAAVRLRARGVKFETRVPGDAPRRSGGRAGVDGHAASRIVIDECGDIPPDAFAEPNDGDSPIWRRHDPGARGAS